MHIGQDAPRVPGAERCRSVHRGSSSSALTMARYATRPAKSARSDAPKTQSVADLRAQSVGADQEVRLSRIRRGRASNRRKYGHCRCAKSTTVAPSVKFDVRLPADCFDQRALQIRAMNDQIWRAPAAFGVIQRHPHQFGVIRTAQRSTACGVEASCAAHDRARQVERGRGSRSESAVGRRQIPRACSLSRIALPETRLRQCYCCRKSADPSAGDDCAPWQASGYFAQLAFGRRAGSA